jgi:vinculin
MTPQVINAGKIRLHYASEHADAHFENLRREFAEALQRLRSLVDDAIDTADFVTASGMIPLSDEFFTGINICFWLFLEEIMRRYTSECEVAIRENLPQKMVDNTSNIARLGNRVLMVAKNEADNSEDPHFVNAVNSAAGVLENSECFTEID